MTNFTEVASVSSGRPGTFTDQLRLAVAAYRARFKAPPASTPNRTCAATSPGVQSAAWTRSPHGVRTWSSISGGCRRSAGSSLPLCPGGFRSPLGFTAPPSSTASWSTRPLSTSAVPPCPPSPRARRITNPRIHPPAIRGAVPRKSLVLPRQPVCNWLRSAVLRPRTNLKP